MWEQIIAVAIPRITDQFHELNDVGWYGSAYLLTACCMYPLSSRELSVVEGCLHSRVVYIRELSITPK